MKEKLNKLLKLAVSKRYFVIEMVFFIGLFIIVFTNFLVNLYLGLYFVGFALMAYSIFLFKFRQK
ncbi:hypothetical protein CTER_5114 [Ruminiclostridium cellobioparum subsp. termitidis CT1112]|uniref:Uncharacterized protein n=1 Tax=Ruminiclostridium cellobioparum subsp. termitidis CT1112 TaxID=1195236 RepID=S0FY33_RUMCE|nr:hypothetical protein CTER_5114 [Ruminiclostridium cellobioparum subsp. termitidis CT1112]